MMPSWLADYVHGLRKPSARWVRIPAGLLLIAGGVFSILPGLGIWMLPLGLMLLALDFALVRRPTAAMVVGGERKWTQIRRWWRERRDAGT
ncbi:MAG TPA: hypothetical protein VEH84_04275 [Alphaproteobacteria bacterium]|nr:hypothetical protein [Alphaproteobacteria bacterium]